MPDNTPLTLPQLIQKGNQLLKKQNMQDGELYGYLVNIDRSITAIVNNLEQLSKSRETDDQETLIKTSCITLPFSRILFEVLEKMDSNDGKMKSKIWSCRYRTLVLAVDICNEHGNVIKNNKAFSQKFFQSVLTTFDTIKSFVKSEAKNVTNEEKDVNDKIIFFNYLIHYIPTVLQNIEIENQEENQKKQISFQANIALAHIHLSKGLFLHRCETENIPLPQPLNKKECLEKALDTLNQSITVYLPENREPQTDEEKRIYILFLLNKCEYQFVHIKLKELTEKEREILQQELFQMIETILKTHLVMRNSQMSSTNKTVEEKIQSILERTLRISNGNLIFRFKESLEKIKSETNWPTEILALFDLLLPNVIPEHQFPKSLETSEQMKEALKIIFYHSNNLNEYLNIIRENTVFDNKTKALLENIIQALDNLYDHGLELSMSYEQNRPCSQDEMVLGKQIPHGLVNLYFITVLACITELGKYQLPNEEFSSLCGKTKNFLRKIEGILLPRCLETTPYDIDISALYSYRCQLKLIENSNDQHDELIYFYCNAAIMAFTNFLSSNEAKCYTEKDIIKLTEKNNTLILQVIEKYQTTFPESLLSFLSELAKIDGLPKQTIETIKNYSNRLTVVVQQDNDTRAQLKLTKIMCNLITLKDTITGSFATLQNISNRNLFTRQQQDEVHQTISAQMDNIQNFLIQISEYGNNFLELSNILIPDILNILSVAIGFFDYFPNTNSIEEIQQRTFLHSSFGICAGLYASIIDQSENLSEENILKTHEYCHVAIEQLSFSLSLHEKAALASDDKALVHEHIPLLKAEIYFELAKISLLLPKSLEQFSTIKKYLIKSFKLLNKYCAPPEDKMIDQEYLEKRSELFFAIADDYCKIFPNDFLALIDKLKKQLNPFWDFEIKMPTELQDAYKKHLKKKKKKRPTQPTTKKRPPSRKKTFTRSDESDRGGETNIDNTPQSLTPAPEEPELEPINSEPKPKIPLFKPKKKLGKKQRAQKQKQEEREERQKEREEKNEQRRLAEQAKSTAAILDSLADGTPRNDINAAIQLPSSPTTPVLSLEEKQQFQATVDEAPRTLNSSPEDSDTSEDGIRWYSESCELKEDDRLCYQPGDTKPRIVKVWELTSLTSEIREREEDEAYHLLAKSKFLAPVRGTPWDEIPDDPESIQQSFDEWRVKTNQLEIK